MKKPRHEKTRREPGFFMSGRIGSAAAYWPLCSDSRLALADATLWTGISPASVMRIVACASFAAAVVALIQVDCR